jgi:hypothetical protein
MWSPSNMDPMMEPLARQDTYGRTPEARVLIIMTGGTICMQKSADGLVPVRGFLETCMAPRREFNDGIDHENIDVSVAEDVTKKMKSLRTPKSTYGKRVRYVLARKVPPFPLLRIWLIEDGPMLFPRSPSCRLCYPIL